MANLKCSMCGSSDLKELSSNVMTPIDRATYAWGRAHPVAGLAALAVAAGGLAYKLLMTKVYHCSSCGYQFRK